MDELMLMEYLKSKGIDNMSEHEFIHKFKEFMHKYGGTSYMRYHNDMDDWYPDYDIKYRKRMSPMKRHQDYSEYPYTEYPEFHMTEVHSRRGSGKYYGGFNRMQDEYYNEHFDEESAKLIVADMYHIEKGRKNIGEKFNMHKAKEVYDRYKTVLASDVTIWDIYVAINAQYHDYYDLFKSWFSGDVESKIIESAVIFWFKDPDYNKGFKLTDYFHGM